MAGRPPEYWRLGAADIANRVRAGEVRAIDIVDAHLALPGAPRCAEARLEYARWKPGVSTTCAWHVRFEGDEEEHLVGGKLYASGKNEKLADHFEVEPGEEDEESQERLLPRGHAPERHRKVDDAETRDCDRDGKRSDGNPDLVALYHTLTAIGER